MKSFLMLVVVVMVSSVAAAAQAAGAAETTAEITKVVGDTRLTADKGNVYSQLCLAALDSEYVLEARANELNIHDSRLRQITCNGYSIRAFARRYGKSQEVTGVYRLPGRDRY